MSQKSSLFTKEEELLLQDYGNELTKKSTMIFYIHAVFVSALPIWLFHRIHQMELTDNAILFILGTALSTYFVCRAYKNNKFQLKHKIAQKRGESVTSEVVKKLESKKTSRKEKDDRISWRKNEVAETESTQLAVLYSNSLYLILLVLASFFLFKNYAPLINYVVSMAGASGLTYLLSTSSKK